MTRERAERIRDRLYVLDGAPERYDQRLTQALQLVLNAEALLAECDG